MLPTISIVTACHNHGHFLEQTITSILDQGYPKLQYIVIDDGSTDHSADVIRKYEDHLFYWSSEPQSGQYVSLNKGFDVATGDVLGWLNADDYFCPWTFATVSSIFDEVEECAWLTTLNKILFDAGGYPRMSKVKGYSRESFIDGRHNYGSDASSGLGVVQQESTFWRKELWQESGGALDVSCEYAADFELWARFYDHADMYATVSPMGGPRIHSDQRHLLNERSYLRETDEIVDRMRKRFASDWSGYDGEFKNYTGFRVRRGIGLDEKWYGEQHSFSG